MPSFIDKNGNYGYVRSGYTMSGDNPYHLTNHKEDMEQICNEIIDQKLNQLMKTLSESIPSAIEEYGRTVWSHLIDSLGEVLQTDIYSQVNVGFEGLREVFYGEKCQKYISDSIMKQMTKELSKIKGITIK